MASLGDLFRKFFWDSGYMPHGHCYFWQPALIWTHVLSDFLIGSAYVAISVTLYVLVRRVRLPFSFVVICFGTFIAACGATHFLEVYTLWIPAYWLSAAIKVITALASVGTGIYLFQLRHPIVAVAEAAKTAELKGQQLEKQALDLESANKELQAEIEERKKAEESLRKAEEALRESNADLERKIEERTRLLQESSERFEAIANNIPQLAWMADPTGYIFWYNERWYNYTGTNLESMKGWGWQSVHRPDYVSKVTEKFKRHIESGEIWEDTFPIRSKTGEWRWFLSRAMPIRGESGRIVRWFGSNTDITEQKNARESLERSEENLRRTTEHLKEALDARDEFLSIASHELKTPLTSLKLQAQIFKRRVMKRDPNVTDLGYVTELAEEMDLQVTRLNRLVEDMLDIARIRAKKLSLAPEKVDLCELAKSVLVRLRPQYDTGRAFPVLQSCIDARGEWDRFRIEQVLTNLLSNALRYGEGRPIEISISGDEQVVALSVKDSGIGIEPEKQEKIFDRFERAVSANEVSGLGLGLFITKQIVLAHGGRIWVESELGKGSTFHVVLPRRISRQEAVDPASVV